MGSDEELASASGEDDEDDDDGSAGESASSAAAAGDGCVDSMFADWAAGFAASPSVPNFAEIIDDGDDGCDVKIDDVDSDAPSAEARCVADDECNSSRP